MSEARLSKDSEGRHGSTRSRCCRLMRAAISRPRQGSRRTGCPGSTRSSGVAIRLVKPVRRDTWEDRARRPQSLQQGEPASGHVRVMRLFTAALSLCLPDRKVPEAAGQLGQCFREHSNFPLPVQPQRAQLRKRAQSLRKRIQPATLVKAADGKALQLPAGLHGSKDAQAPGCQLH